MRRVVALFILMAFSPLVFGQAYKWKDAQGVTHYSDSPPPSGTKYDMVKTTGSVVPPAGASVPAPAPAPKPAASTTAPSGPTADTPQNRKKLCADLQSNIGVLNKPEPVSVDDGKGGRVQLDDAGRKRQIETAQAQMTLYCK